MRHLFFEGRNEPRPWLLFTLLFSMMSIIFVFLFVPLGDNLEKKAEFYQNMTSADRAHVASIRKGLEASPPAGSLIIWKKGGMYVVHEPTLHGALTTYWYPSHGGTGYKSFYQDVDDFTLFNIERIVLPSDAEYGSFAYKFLSGL